jgi:hypothetical protein
MLRLVFQNRDLEYRAQKKRYLATDVNQNLF